MSQPTSGRAETLLALVVLAVIAIGLATWFLVHNTVVNMRIRGIQSGFDFLLGPEELGGKDDPSRLADTIAAHLPLKLEQKQEVLEMESIRERIDRLLSQLEERLNSPVENQPIILLFDGLDAVQQLPATAQSSLANLLMHGPHALIWPVVTVNASLALELSYWLSFFRTRLYGQILHQPTARSLTSLPGAPLGNLAAPNQFCLREKAHWLKFWRPSL